MARHCFAVSLVSYYQSNPRVANWQVVKRIKRYLYGIANLIFCYRGGDLKLRGSSKMSIRMVTLWV